MNSYPGFNILISFLNFSPIFKKNCKKQNKTLQESLQKISSKYRMIFKFWQLHLISCYSFRFILKEAWIVYDIFLHIINGRARFFCIQCFQQNKFLENNLSLLVLEGNFNESSFMDVGETNRSISIKWDVTPKNY